MKLEARTAVRLVIALAALTLLLGELAQARALKGQDESLARIEVALADANVKVRRLNGQLESLSAIDTRLGTLTKQTLAIGSGVGRSARLTGRADRQTATLVAAVDGVAGATNALGGRLGELSGQTDALAGQVQTLKGTVDPLAADTRSVRGSVDSMNASLGRMNGSLRYVIRVLDYLAAPPFGGPFSVRVTLDKKALPPLQGVSVQTAPIAVFRRGAWAQYHGR